MNNKTALIIGASRGIGRAVALRLAQDGFDIVATCRSTIDALTELTNEIESIGRKCAPLAFDISDRQASEQALQQYFAEAAPDIIVYNASIARDGLFAFMPGEDWDNVLHTNLDGFFNVVKPLIFNMLYKKSGRIIAMTSASGQVGQPGQINYSASKAGLIGADKS
jgi:3-oxoacyl-[acyl-carrier protein] reductase